MGRRRQAQLICEIHRYPNLEHRTDAVTVHGLDVGDVEAIAAAFGALAKRGVNSGSIFITHTEHMNVRKTQRHLAKKAWFIAS